MSKVLVTGGAGFIGSFTVDLLVDKGYDVVVMDNYEYQVHLGRRPDYLNGKAKYIDGDVRHEKHWMRALEGVDYIVHLAAAVGVGQSFWEARKYVSVNVTGTAILYQILIKNRNLAKNIRKIVVASSKSIYGEGAYRCPEHGEVHPGPRSVEQLRRGDWEQRCPICGRPVEPIGIREEKPPQNLSPYALSKYATERLALQYSDVLGIPTVAFRYFNVYGPRQSLNNPYTGVVAIFLSRMKNGRSPVVFEDGRQVRDFVYVGDISRINVMALEDERIAGAVNVGTGRPTSLLEMIGMLRELTGSSVEPEITGEFRPGDNRHDYADVTRLRAMMGDYQFTGVREGLAELVEWSEGREAKDMFEREERERNRFLGSGAR
ncbi:MAG: SDR family NAD(P)-dependent oxidoreductase [Conexivisphaera sp.]